MTTIKVVHHFIHNDVCLALFGVPKPILTYQNEVYMKYVIDTEELQVEIITHTCDESMLVYVQLHGEARNIDVYPMLKHINNGFHAYDVKRGVFFASSITYEENVRVIARLGVFLTLIYNAHVDVEKVKKQVSNITLSEVAHVIVEKAYPGKRIAQAIAYMCERS